MTSVAEGSATITATSGSAIATASVTVTQVASALSLSDSVLTFDTLADTTQLTVTVTDANGEVIDGAPVTWNTSNDAVVIGIKSTGLVTSVTYGTATITATSGSASATATVTVAQVAAAVSLSDSTLTFGSLADTTQLTATVTDANGEVIDGAPVTWDYIERRCRERIIHGSRDFSGFRLGHDHRDIRISDCNRERDRRHSILPRNERRDDHLLGCRRR